MVFSGFKRYFAPNYEPCRRSILSERNIVVVLFGMVLITFSLAHEDTKKMEQIYKGVNATTASYYQKALSEAGLKIDPSIIAE